MQQLLHQRLTQHLQNMKQVIAEERNESLVRIGEHLAWALRDLGEYSGDAEVKELTEQMYALYVSVGKSTLDMHTK